MESNGQSNAWHGMFVLPATRVSPRLVPGRSCGDDPALTRNERTSCTGIVQLFFCPVRTHDPAYDVSQPRPHPSVYEVIDLYDARNIFKSTEPKLRRVAPHRNSPLLIRETRRPGLPNFGRHRRQLLWNADSRVANPPRSSASMPMPHRSYSSFRSICSVSPTSNGSVPCWICGARPPESCSTRGHATNCVERQRRRCAHAAFIRHSIL